MFNPIRGATTGIGGTLEKRMDGKKVEKKNSLYSKVAKMQVDWSVGGGVYTLSNISTPQGTFLDI